MHMIKEANQYEGWARFVILAGGTGSFLAPDERMASAVLGALAHGSFLLRAEGAGWEGSMFHPGTREGYRISFGLDLPDLLELEQKERQEALRGAITSLVSSKWASLGGNRSVLGIRALSLLALLNAGKSLGQWVTEMDQKGVCRCLAHAQPRFHERRKREARLLSFQERRVRRADWSGRFAAF